MGLRGRTSLSFRNPESDGSTADNFEAQTVVTAQRRNAAQALCTTRCAYGTIDLAELMRLSHAGMRDGPENAAVTPTGLTIQPRDVDLLATAAGQRSIVAFPGKLSTPATAHPFSAP